MLKPRIFISAVSGEFGALRKLVAEIITRLGYDPESQHIFGADAGDLRQVLRDKIDQCDGLIQIVGQAYGAEPPTADENFGRVSYTQFELLYAQQQGKTTWIIMPTDGCTRDKPLAELDLRPSPDHPDAAAWQQERRSLQAAYRERLRQSGQLWHPTSDDKELALTVERLRDEFSVLRRQFRRWQGRVGSALAAILVLLLIIGGGVWWNSHRQQESLERQEAQIAQVRENQPVTVERIRGHLLESADRVRQQALKEAEEADGWEDREKLREAAEKAHENTFSRIDELVDDFAKIEGTAPATDVYNEMTRILAEEGVDAALKYLDRHREDAFARAARRKEELRTELQPYLTAANLKAVNGQTDAARAEFERLMAADGDWPELLYDYGWFLRDVAYFSYVHGTLATSIRDGAMALQLAERLNSSSTATPEHKRLLSATLDINGDALVMRGQEGDAARAIAHFEHSLEIDETLLKSNPDSAQAAREVSESLIHLGDFLSARGQEGDAAAALAHYERSLGISEALWKRDPTTATAFDVSASLERLGAFLAARGLKGDCDSALSHFRRSLDLRELILRFEPESVEAQRNVAGAHHNLGALLSKRGQEGDGAAALMHYRRALDIEDKILRSNPASAVAARLVAQSLDALGVFLAARGETGDAEAALKYQDRALTIQEDLLASNPESATAKEGVALSLERLGTILAERNKNEDGANARKYLERSLGIREENRSANPGIANYALPVAVTHFKLGELLSSSGDQRDSQTALCHHEQSLAIRNDIWSSNQNSISAAIGVSESLEELGELLRARGQEGDAATALAYYERSLEIREAVLKSSPDSAEAARAVSFVSDTLGDLLSARRQKGDSAAALAHYERSLGICETQLKSNPDLAQAVRDVVVSHYKIATLVAASGTNGKNLAILHRRTCYELLHPRITSGMTFDPPIIQLYEELKAEFGEQENEVIPENPDDNVPSDTKPNQ